MPVLSFVFTFITLILLKLVVWIFFWIDTKFYDLPEELVIFFLGWRRLFSLMNIFLWIQYDKLVSNHPKSLRKKLPAVCKINVIGCELRVIIITAGIWAGCAPTLHTWDCGLKKNTANFTTKYITNYSSLVSTAYWKEHFVS